MSLVVAPAIMATWPKPNYINPDTNTKLLLATHIPLVIITTIVVVLRVVTRCFITRSFGRDDAIMVAATIVATTLMVLNCFAAVWGWGYHIWDFEPSWVKPARLLAFSEEILFVVSIALTKVSILCFYLRVFSEKSFRKLVYAGLAYTIAWLVACVFVVLLQCQPIQAYWDYSIEGKCLNSYAAFLCTAIFNSISDFYIFFLPLKQIWDIQLPAKQRIGLLAVFSLGLIACVAGFVRMYYIKTIFHDSVDWTWYGAYLYVATAVEVDIGILCASIPSLKPLFTRFFPSILSSGSRSIATGRSRMAADPHKSQGYPLGSYDGRMNNQIKSGNMSRIDHDDSDTYSEDLIIQSHETPRHEGPGIHRKVEVHVQYDEESMTEVKVDEEDDSRRVRRI